MFDIIQNILTARCCSLPIYFLTFFNLLSFCIETHTYWLLFLSSASFGKHSFTFGFGQCICCPWACRQMRKRRHQVSPQVCLSLGFSSCFSSVNTQMNLPGRLMRVCALLWIYVMGWCYGRGWLEWMNFTQQLQSVLESLLVNVFWWWIWSSAADAEAEDLPWNSWKAMALVGNAVCWQHLINVLVLFCFHFRKTRQVIQGQVGTAVFFCEERECFPG